MPLKNKKKILAEKVLEKVMRVMAIKYGRPEHVKGYANDFLFPWDEHLPAAVPNQRVKFCPSCRFPTQSALGVSMYMCANCRRHFS